MERRKTQSTEEILAALKTAQTALSHNMIQEKLDIEVDRATIYRVLNRFCEDGLVHRVMGDNGKQYFALCKNCEQNDHRHNHFHFKCRECGRVECLSKTIETTLPKGYVAEHFNGLISGLCAACASGT